MSGKENKNPLLAGLINVLIPGAGQLYVNKDRGRFAGAFIANIMALAATVALGNLIQQSREYSLPQGLCMGILIMAVITSLFASGYNMARVSNNEKKAAVLYRSKKHVSDESDEAKRMGIQKMRDEGLISAQEYDDKNAKVGSNKK